MSSSIDYHTRLHVYLKKKIVPNNRDFTDESVGRGPGRIAPKGHQNDSTQKEPNTVIILNINKLLPK